MKNFAFTWAVIAAVVLVIFWPWAVIWAANTLFGLGIAYTFQTWLAVLILSATFGKASIKTKEK